MSAVSPDIYVSGTSPSRWYTLLVLWELMKASSSRQSSQSHLGAQSLAYYNWSLSSVPWSPSQWHSARESTAQSASANSKHLQASKEAPLSHPSPWKVVCPHAGTSGIGLCALCTLPLVVKGYTRTNPKSDANTCAHLLFLCKYVLENLVGKVGSHDISIFHDTNTNTDVRHVETCRKKAQK